MRHNTAVNAWRIIKISLLIVSSYAIYLFVVDYESLQSDNVKLSNIANILMKTCIVVGK
jgi:hypothetical protein